MSLSQGKNDAFGSGEFQEDLNILREIGFFRSFPLECLKVFAYMCARERYRSGDFLFREGEDDGQAFFVLSGTARLLCPGQDGIIEIREFGPGDFIGGLCLLGSMPRLFSLQASEETVCLVIPREKFAKALEQFPELMPKITSNLVESINTWEKRFIRNRSDSCDACRHKIGVSLI